MRVLEVGQTLGAGSCQAEISVACSVLGSRPLCGRKDGESLLGVGVEVKFRSLLFDY